MDRGFSKNSRRFFWHIVWDCGLYTVQAGSYVASPYAFTGWTVVSSHEFVLPCTVCIVR